MAYWPSLLQYGQRRGMRLLYLSPVAGALVLTWWLGGYALASGVLLLALAFRLRGRRDVMRSAASIRP